MPSRAPDEPVAPRPAGLGRRLGAMLYDGLLIGFALAPAVVAAGIVLRIALEGAGAVGAAPVAVRGPLLQMALLLTPVVFFGWFWTRHGQTLGMQTWRIRLVGADGGAVRWPQALLRLAGASISIACLGGGYLWILCDRERLAWHDRWSRTRVIEVPPTPATPRV